VRPPICVPRVRVAGVRGERGDGGVEGGERCAAGLTGRRQQRFFHGNPQNAVPRPEPCCGNSWVPVANVGTSVAACRAAVEAVVRLAIDPQSAEIGLDAGHGTPRLFPRSETRASTVRRRRVACLARRTTYLTLNSPSGQSSGSRVLAGSTSVVRDELSRPAGPWRIVALDDQREVDGEREEQQPTATRASHG
jgi:hypothetical protein